MKHAFLIAVLAAVTASSLSAAEQLLVRPGSARGKIVIVNAQKTLAATNFDSVVRQIRSIETWQVTVVPSADQAKDAALVLSLVESPTGAPLAVEPDLGRATVNLTALVSDLRRPESRQRFLASRARKMLLRAFCYAAGAGGSGFKGNLLDIAVLSDLDHRHEALPVDAMDAARRHLLARGLQPEILMTYAEACEEGWAPAPKTPEQKTIWEEYKDPKKRFDKDLPQLKKRK